MRRVLRLCACCVVMMGLLVGCNRHGDGNDRIRKCVSQLKSLAYVCHMYAEDHEDKYPPDFGELFGPTYVSDGRLFLCSGVGSAVEFTKTGLPSGPEDVSGVLGPRHTDYGYVSGLATDGDPGWVLVFDKASHPGGVRNVAHLGGHITAMSERELKQRLKATLEEARARGHDARVWGYPSGCDLVDTPAPPTGD